MAKYVVTLTQEERKELSTLTTKGKTSAAKVLNALILLNCDCGDFQLRNLNVADIAHALGTSTRKIERLKKRFVEEGLDMALTGKKRGGPPPKKADGEFEARLLAMGCGTPPEGRTRWTLRLLADKAVELGYVDSISHEPVREVLKKTKSSRGKNGCG